MAREDEERLAALIRQSEPDELWDIYDAAGHRTGRVQRRGDAFAGDDRHLCVHVWVRDPRGAYLLTRRAPEKCMAGLWECTGGSALLGEDSLTAALRELREETGLRLRPEQGALLLRFAGEHYFCDVWRFLADFTLDDVTLRPGETDGKRLAGKEELRRLDEEGALFSFEDLRRILDGD